jgi:hypothetical protein
MRSWAEPGRDVKVPGDRRLSSQVMETAAEDARLRPCRLCYGKNRRTRGHSPRSLMLADLYASLITHIASVLHVLYARMPATTGCNHFTSNRTDGAGTHAVS